jgi:hypothetical protein
VGFKRLKPHERKPRHTPGLTTYVQIRSYDPATKVTKHRGLISLKGWHFREVRELIIKTFTEHQVQQVRKGEHDPQQPIAWTGGHLDD